jgi:hypothetical protein
MDDIEPTPRREFVGNGSILKKHPPEASSDTVGNKRRSKISGHQRLQKSLYSQHRSQQIQRISKYGKVCQEKIEVLYCAVFMRVNRYSINRKVF